MPLSPGQILQERYRIDALIGQGGFGAVYRAWDLVQNRVCACKENLDTREAAVDQFGQEAVVLASLSHPNLPRVTDHFVLPDKGQYLVMDFVEGRSLATLMAERGGALSEGELLPWIDQVCEALTYLHSQLRPIIHRDIKPQNIIITPAGRAMLVDFGTSKVADPGALTRPGGRAVTTGFSPPEQYGLAGRTDARSDIYALGATLYAALTGRIPPDSVDRLQGNASFAPPRQLRPEISRTTETAILKAMEPHAAQRFQTIEELRRTLAGRAASPPATRAVGGALPVTRRAEPRATGFHPPRRLLALGGLALAAIIGLSLYLGGVLPPRMPTSRSTTPVSALPGNGQTPIVNASVADVSGPPASGQADVTGAAGSPAGALATSTIQTGAAAPGLSATTATTPAGMLSVISSGDTDTPHTALPAQAATPLPAPSPTLRPSPTPVPSSTEAPLPPATTVTPTRDSSRSAIARPSLTPLPDLSVLGPALIHELFSSDSTGWPSEADENEFAKWKVSLNRGRYRIEVVALDVDVTAYAAAPEFTLRDFLLVTDATLIGSSGMALQRLYFRCQDPLTDYCYVADFYSNGEYALGRLEGGEYTAIQEHVVSRAIRTRPGDTNTFAVLASGSTFTLYANGQTLRTLTDRTYPNAGYFLLGVGVPNQGDDAVVEFDNLFVVQPAGQTPPDELPEEVTPAHVLLFERFDDNKRGWNVGADNDELSDDDYQVTAGVLAASVTAKGAVITSRGIPNLQVADFGLWVDTTFTSYSAVGQVNIIFRCRDNSLDDCFRVRFATDGTYAISRWQAGEHAALVDWTDSPEIRTGAGATNNFGVVVRGSLVQVFANDVLLRSFAVDGPAGAGGLRLGVGAFDAGTQVTVEFDNLLVVEDAAGP